jgi:hypothetical protein
MRTTMRLVAVCAALAAAGCGDDSKMGGDSFAPHRGFQATCNSAFSGICTTYVSGYSSQDLASQRSMCNVSDWSTTAACPTANRIGRCTMTQGPLTWTNAYYPASGSTADGVGCLNMGGSWAAN